MRSAFGDDDFQIFAWNDHGAVGRGIHAANQSQQILAEPLLACSVERRKGFQHRTVIVPEYLQEMLGRAIAEREMATLGLDRCGRRSKHLGDARRRAPKRGRLRARWRRQVLAQRLEDLTDETFRRPVGQAYLAAAL